MTVTWDARDPVERLPITTDDPALQRFERWVRAYVNFGWEIVQRDAYPSTVRLTYPALRRTLAHYIADRVIWMDKHGVVRVERVDD